MLKKRIIFTLLYNSGKFVLSRNFRLQNVGDINWLHNNYNFSKVAFFIDELIIINVTRGHNDFDNFCTTVKKITSKCFLPIAAGGWVSNLDQVKKLLRSGADKVIINSSLFYKQNFVKEIATNFGQQCIVGSIDLKKCDSHKYVIVTNHTTFPKQISLANGIDVFKSKEIGEIYLNSIDQAGTGYGYDLNTLDLVPNECQIPIILAGGVGNSHHFKSGLKHNRVNAVATAHLFNFIGDGLMKARNLLLGHGYDLANWVDRDIIQSVTESK